MNPTLEHGEERKECVIPLMAIGAVDDQVTVSLKGNPPKPGSIPSEQNCMWGFVNGKCRKYKDREDKGANRDVSRNGFT